MKSEDVNDKYSTADYMRDSFRKEFFFGVGDSVNIHLDTWKDNIKGSFAEFEFENISEENTYFLAKKITEDSNPIIIAELTVDDISKMYFHSKTREVPMGRESWSKGFKYHREDGPL